MAGIEKLQAHEIKRSYHIVYVESVAWVKKKLFKN